jgi:GTP cyclohydrolase I
MSSSLRDYAKVEAGFRLVLEGLGLDLNDPHLQKTPHRAAKAWWNELCAGVTQIPPPITSFPSASNQMVLLRDIPVRSMCLHHLLPFRGTACVAYVPGRGQIVGLSKLSRIVDHWCRRPQVQEELTEQIADALAGHVMDGDQGGVGVVIQASHMCMELRGVNHRGDMITSALRGVLNEAAARSEFLRLSGYG